MADAKAFTGIALADSTGGSVLVRINLEPAVAEDQESEWEEALDYDTMSDDELLADAMADVTEDSEDPASVETDEDDEYVSEIFDEEED